MIYKIYPSKDAFVTNYLLRGSAVTGSNTGGSEILELWRRSDPLDTANILIQFPAPTIAIGPSASYWLHLCDAQHGQTLASGYEAIVTPNTQEWVEGNGHDLDFWTDKGVCNWSYAKNGSLWASGGAYPVAPSGSASFYFDNGHEDLVVDVTDLMVSATHGFHITVDPQLTASNYYVKAFFGRSTHYTSRRPSLEVRWNDATGTLSDLFRGWMDPQGDLQVTLYDLKPVYYSNENPTLHVYVRPRNFNPAIQASASYTVGFLSGGYATSGSIRLSSEVASSVLTNAYYRVVDDRTDEVVVPFGTGAVPFTKLSYNDEGDYFKLYMQNFATGSILRIDFMYEAPSGSGNWTVVRDDNNKFRVR